MIDVSVLLDNPGHDRFDIGDNNHDGVVDIHDMPYEPGSLEAKQQWAIVDSEAHSAASVAKARAAGFPDATGWYHGKPLSDQFTGPQYATYQYTVDKVHWYDGLDWPVAKKIAARSTSNMEWSEAQ